MQYPRTTEDAQDARQVVANYRYCIAQFKAQLARYEAEAVLAADAKNAEQRAAQVVLALAANETMPNLQDAIRSHTLRIAELEAALLRYAEERADRMTDLRERELAQRLAAGG